jgi:general secretion pathway protein I
VRAPTRQRGFTLIEVLVAFAVFCLCVGALYESLHMGLKRHEETTRRSTALATAQSLLSQLRVQPPAWPADQQGTSSAGKPWHIHIEPYATDAAEQAPDSPPPRWRAYRVVVSVDAGRAGAHPVQLESLEITRAE